jgi:uncharacterized protein DUF6896
MHPILADTIQRFRDAQDRGVEAIVEVLGGTLGVRLPASNREWGAICVECGLHHVRWINGINVYVHGYGIELIFPDITIDFDWGDSGESDGFDTWRLWNFLCVNKVNEGHPYYAQIKSWLDNRGSGGSEGYLQIESWLEEAHECGELTRDRCLYYSRAHRSPRQRMQGGPNQPFTHGCVGGTSEDLPDA